MKKIALIVMTLTLVNVYAQDKVIEFANFGKYENENAQLPKKKKLENRVVFMGNSITEFWKVNRPDFFESTGYIDRGISGQTTSQMLLRFRRDIIEIGANTVVFLAGINDIAQNNGPIALKDVYGNIVSMVELAMINNIRPVICSVLPANHFPWSPNIKPADQVIELNQWLKSFAERNNLVYVDYYSAMVNDEKGLSPELAEDGVHPTVEGYKIMEPLVVEGIKKAQRK